MDINTAIILAYFILLIAIGWIFRTFNTNTSDYFRAGGGALWWMVGATAFMTQFSAWTFTGAAGKAYLDGFPIALMFTGNAVGYLLAYMYFAAKFRQLRIVTVMEGVRMRFGRASEQVFTWGGLPNQLLSGGIWLNGLAIVIAVVFDIDMETTIILTGLVVLVMSVTGGSWAVIASDYLQMVIIMVVCVICSAVAVVQGGGVSEIVANFPVDDNGSFISGNNLNYLGIFSIWVVCIFFNQSIMLNNMTNAHRYLSAKDSISAKNAALLAFGLMFAGIFIWFTPSWFIAGQGVDLYGVYPEYGNKAIDYAYIYFVKEYMPAGMLGLMVAAIFASTMSSMDTGLNKSAGIFVRSFYLPILRPDATEKELLTVSKIASTVCGLIIIAVALFMHSLKHMDLFNITMTVASLIAFPTAIAPLLGMFIKNTPDWSAWATLAVGAVVSYIVGFVLTPADIEQWFSLGTLTAREWADIKVIAGVLGHLVITGGFFVSTTLFYKPLSSERQKEVGEFFHNLATPVVNNSEQQGDLDKKQKNIIGKLMILSGGLIALMSIIPNEAWGRLTYLSGGLVVLAVGYLMMARMKKSVQPDFSVARN
ncbi:sodium:solute symporter family transporter [Endozoicomonas atrinae]|uniref:sodium:solute symporter family transporter n=1 Tax=Endozoicomonas atrinae TaxID=1333660 RepID=UPI000824B1A5|nr:transporter [Endozoicomonas atrinae]